MELTNQLALIDIFRRQALAARHEEEQLIEFGRRRQREKKEALQEKHEQEELAKFEEMMLATAEQVEQFYNHLDVYDTATVHALMDNDRALDEVRHDRQRMEAAAYRLPDGRLAFKSEDGTGVFDRQGAPISQEIVHPEAIPDGKPKWEAFNALGQTEDKLVHERQDVLHYQRQLDEARDTAGKGNVTADALAKLNADLKRSMPDAVKAHMQGAPTAAGLDGSTIAKVPASPQLRPIVPVGQAFAGP